MNKRGTFVHLPELRRGRVHEVSGPSGTAFAFLMARRGSILLCGAPWRVSGYLPEAVARFCDPDAILHVHSPLDADTLWAAETALRSGCMATVILIMERSPGLTAFRRLQLAAQAGRSLGLLIVSQPAHSTAAETRWHCSPVLSDQWEEFRINASLFKNRKGKLGSWVLDVSGETDTLHLVATPAGEPVWPERIAH